MIPSVVRRAASVVVTVLALVVVAAFVVQAVPAVVGADASYVVLSGSMEPTISTGDAVVVNSVDPADVERGDVITFVRAGESTPVTHRVVGVRDTESGLVFETKGDANDAPDPDPVPASNVTGEVWFTIPYIGHVVMFANTPTGMAALVGVPIGLLILSELYDVVRGDAAEAVDSTGATADTAPASTTDAAAAGADGPATEPDSGQAHDSSDQAHDRTGQAHDSADDGPATLTVTGRDLRFTGVVTAAFAAYAGYVASLRPTPVRVGVFAGVAVVLLFVATLLAFGDDGSDAAADDGERAAVGDGATATDGGDARSVPDGGGEDVE